MIAFLLAQLPAGPVLLGLVVSGLAIGWTCAAIADPRPRRRLRLDASRVWRRLMEGPL